MQLPSSTAASIAASRTTAAWLRTGQQAFHDSSGASDAGFYLYGGKRTILFAGAALHTRVPVNNRCSLCIHCENSVGTNIDAHTASPALLNIELQRHNIF
jgi:hypothetical protein